MRSTLLQTFLLIIVFVALLALTMPLEFLFQKVGINDFRSNYLAEIISRIPIIVLAVILISRLRFTTFNGVNAFWRIRNPQSLIVAVTLFAVLLYGNWANYSIASHFDVALYFLSAVLVGLAEETVFRGILLPMWIRKSGSVFWGMLISSALFGSIHFINLFHQPGNLGGITSQVLVGTALGFFFAGLMFRTRNVIVVALLHGFFNIALSSNSFAHEIRNLDLVKEKGTSDLPSVIFSIAILLFLVLSGILMSRWEGKQKIQARA